MFRRSLFVLLLFPLVLFFLRQIKFGVCHGGMFTSNGEQEGISVECTFADSLCFIVNRFRRVLGGRGWGPVQWGPSWTNLDIALYRWMCGPHRGRVLHKGGTGPGPLNRMTDTTKKITFPQHRWREVKKRSVVHTRSLKITGSDLPPEPLSIIEAAFRNSVRMRTIATNQS